MKTDSEILCTALSIDHEMTLLETALNRRTGKYTVKLSNIGNPDHRQDPRRPLPDTTCGFACVDSFEEASALCLTYISFYELGGGNWNGGEIETSDGVLVGYVAYNGNVFEGTKRSWSPKTKKLFIA